MKMSEMTTYCNPGWGWANCWAQRYNCTVEMIEETMADADSRHADDDWKALKHFINTMTAKGYKSAAYCDGCGSKYSG